MSPIELMAMYRTDVEGIIHVGANLGQERFSYLQSGAASCMYIEPITSVFHELQQNIAEFPGHFAVQAVCSNVGGQTVTFNIANNGGQSSSILPMANHLQLMPHITFSGSEQLVTRTLDDIVAHEGAGHGFNLLVVDAQGADLKVLQGATSLLERIDAAYVEIAEVPLYEGGCVTEDVTAFLREQGFFMKWMQIGDLRYGDAFYVRADTAPLPHTLPNVALGQPAAQSSVSRWSRPADAQGGNNGVRTGLYGFHTDKELNPWWQVDLGYQHPIREVRVFNRTDAATERARTLQVLASADGHTWQLLHDRAGRSFGGVRGRPLVATLRQPVPARFVRMQLQASDYLHLDEIEVY